MFLLFVIIFNLFLFYILYKLLQNYKPRSTEYFRNIIDKTNDIMTENNYWNLKDSSEKWTEIFKEMKWKMIIFILKMDI